MNEDFALVTNDVVFWKPSVLYSHLQHTVSYHSRQPRWDGKTAIELLPDYCDRMF
jgi:hypothetical protein